MYKFLIIIIFAFFCSDQASAQASDNTLADSIAHQDFSISYDINIVARKKKTIAETYNGAVKTVYVKNNMVKLRFVSLMRTQNIYFKNRSRDTANVAVVTKESGKQKYKFRLSKSSWRLYNFKYDSVQTTLFEDSLIILNHICKKATLTLKGGQILTAYYLPETKNEAFMAAEPMFSSLPGIVLQYELHDGKKSIIYTATEISFLPLTEAIMKPPTRGYITKKLSPGKTKKDPLLEEEESETEGVEN